MDQIIANTLSRFDPIGLDALNAKAAMLERLDNKYILRAAQLRPALERFSTDFDVLDIGGTRGFTYATRYFDDPETKAYYDHHQGRRKRCKVRVRHYVDAGFSYLEVKLKDTRDVTVKKRLRVENGLDALSSEAMAFVDESYRAMYGEGFDQPLKPVVGMEYQRITLVAKQGGERMTIDTRLRFWSEQGNCAVSPDMAIVETKSARGNGLADQVLRGLHLHPTARVSKYCVAMAALGQVARHNRFLPAMRRLGLQSGAMGPVALAAE